MRANTTPTLDADFLRILTHCKHTYAQAKLDETTLINLATILTHLSRLGARIQREAALPGPDMLVNFSAHIHNADTFLVWLNSFHVSIKPKRNRKQTKVQTKEQTNPGIEKKGFIVFEGGRR